MPLHLVYKCLLNQSPLRRSTPHAGVKLLRCASAVRNWRKVQKSRIAGMGVQLMLREARALACRPNWHSNSPEKKQWCPLTGIHSHTKTRQCLKSPHSGGARCPRVNVSAALQQKGGLHSRFTLVWTSGKQASPVSHTFLPTRNLLHALLYAVSNKTTLYQEGRVFVQVGLRSGSPLGLAEGRRLPVDTIEDKLYSCSQGSDAFDLISSMRVIRNVHTTAAGAKQTTAKAPGLERDPAARTKNGVYSCSAEKNCPAHPHSSGGGSTLRKPSLPPACSASLLTSNDYFADSSNPSFEPSALDRVEKAGVFLVRALPQSLTEAAKWEPSELILKQRQQVVQWKHSKVCVICKKEVQAGALEKVESTCDEAWKFISGYARSHRGCPLLTNMRLIQYAEAPLKDRARFDGRLRRDRSIRRTTK